MAALAQALQFKKNLTDLIRGIRNNKNNESQFISQCIQEIKQELKADNKKDKVNAIQKLTYLQMRGYDMTWAAFNVIEVMSQPKFSSKRVGYLAASQSFSETTEVVMLVTNLIRKDIMSKNQYEAGVAINALANICTPDLARDLAPDVVSMLTSSRPYIRKKAVLVLYKIFLKFPEALRPSFNRLKEKLEDPDPAVVSAAVNVICELARKNPKNYIPLAPTLFKILTTSQNNWMLIKIIKLFCSLTPHEPRLSRRLAEPLIDIMNKTQAMSLLYEVIQTCIAGLTENEDVMKLCIAKLRVFVEHPDQNLKYLGLVAMNGIMQTYPKGVAEHRDLIIGCLDDEDATIRMRALELITGMVTKKNLQVIISKLMDYLRTAEGAYKDDLLEKIVYICSQGSYKFITEFEWYIGVLVDLTRIQGTKHGKLIRDQLLDVCMRVNVIRSYAVDAMVNLIRDSRMLTENPQENGMCETMYAAAWIVGEYSNGTEDLIPVIELFLHSRSGTLPPHIQSVYMETITKLFVKMSTQQPRQAGQRSDFANALEMIESRLPMFTSSQHLEVQERACFLESLIGVYKQSANTGDNIFNEFATLFEEQLNPVGANAQKKVPIPDGLDLDTWINEPPPEPEPTPAYNSDLPTPDEPSFGAGAGNTFQAGSYGSGGGAGIAYGGFGSESSGNYRPSGNYPQASAEEIERRKIAHAQQMARQSQFYLGAASPSSPTQGGGGMGGGQSTPPPNAGHLTREQLGLGNDFKLEYAQDGGSGGSGRHREHRSGRHHRDKRPKEYTVNTAEEMPEGYTPDSVEDKTEQKDDPLAIDLTNIKPTEQLRHQQHRTAATDSPSTAPRPTYGSDVNMLKDDKKHRHREHRKHRDEKQSPSSPSSGGTADLLGFGATPSSPPPSTGQTSPTGQSSPAYQTLNSPTQGGDSKKEGGGEKEHRRHRHHHHRGERGDGERRHKSRRHKEGGDQSQGGGNANQNPQNATSDVANLAASSSGTINKERAKLFYTDNSLDVTYEMKLNSKEPNLLVVLFLFTNKTKQAIFSIELDVQDANGIKWERPQDVSFKGPVLLPWTLHGGQSQTYQIRFRYNTCTLPQKLRSQISFMLQKDNSSEHVKRDIVLNLPCSGYIQPEKIDQQGFIQLLKTQLSGNLQATSLSTSVARAVQAVSVLFNLAILEQTDARASMYGKTILGHHVAVLIKEEGGKDQLALAIKASDAALGENLLREIAELFARRQ